jgi:hypothetical protein
MMPETADKRRLVEFPPAMRQHMLSNMRAHLVALGKIVTALSAGDSAKTAAIAETRLGLDSPGAATCNPNHSADAPAMTAMMAEHMPDEMRNLGFAMHAAASTFAREAANAQQSNDVKPAWRRAVECLLVSLDADMKTCEKYMIFAYCLGNAVHDISSSQNFS